MSLSKTIKNQKIIKTIYKGLNFILVLTLPYSKVSAQKANPENEIEEALVLFEKREFQEAYRILDDIIRLKPTATQAYYYRALVLQEMGDKLGALTDLNKLLVLYPGHAEGLFARAQIHFALKQYDHAKSDYLFLLNSPVKGVTQSVVYQIPRYSDGVSGILSQQSDRLDPIYFHLAASCEALNQYEEALHYIGKAIVLQPTLSDYRLKRAEIHLKSGKENEALKDLNEVLEQEPTHPVAIQLLANLASGKGNSQEAEKLYSEIIRTSPEFLMPYKQRAYARISRGECNEALEDLNMVLQRTPEDQEALAFRARVYEKMERNDDALLDHQKILEINPCAATAYFGIGNIHFKRKQYHAALSAYTQALACQNEFGEAYYQRGIALNYLNKKREACQDLDKSLELGISAAKSAIERICK